MPDEGSAGGAPKPDPPKPPAKPAPQEHPKKVELIRLEPKKIIKKAEKPKMDRRKPKTDPRKPPAGR
jgi:hypothetical protein